MTNSQTETTDGLLVAELQESGIEVKSVYDLVNTSQPYSSAYPILVRHLKLSHDRATREGIIRALTVKDAGPIAEAVLFAEFQVERDPILKWVLANALQTVMPYKKRKKFPEISKALKYKNAP